MLHTLLTVIVVLKSETQTRAQTCHLGHKVAGTTYYMIKNAVRLEGRLQAQPFGQREVTRVS